MHLRIANLILLVLGMSMMAEDSKPEAISPSSAPEPEMWAGFDLHYLVIQLKSAREVRRYYFQGHGFVSGRVGTKAHFGDSAWTYKRDGDWLEIVDFDKKTVFRMRPVKTSAKEIRVDTGPGKTAVFEVVEDHEPPPPLPPLKWEDFDLFGCSLNLKSRTDLIWYLFHKDGSVSATVGKQKGAITAPLWDWRYSGQWLQVLGNDGQLYYQMRLLKVGEKEISIDNGRGQTEVFEIQRFDKPPQGAPPLKASESK